MITPIAKSFGTKQCKLIHIEKQCEANN